MWSDTPLRVPPGRRPPVSSVRFTHSGSRPAGPGAVGNTAPDPEDAPLTGARRSRPQPREPPRAGSLTGRIRGATRRATSASRSMTGSYRVRVGSVSRWPMPAFAVRDPTGAVDTASRGRHRHDSPSGSSWVCRPWNAGVSIPIVSSLSPPLPATARVDSPPEPGRFGRQRRSQPDVPQPAPPTRWDSSVSGVRTVATARRTPAPPRNVSWMATVGVAPELPTPSHESAPAVTSDTRRQRRWIDARNARPRPPRVARGDRWRGHLP